MRIAQGLCTNNCFITFEKLEKKLCILCNIYWYWLNYSGRQLPRIPYNTSDRLTVYSTGIPIPANMRRWPNVGSLLAHRPRRWSNSKSTMAQRLMFAGLGWDNACRDYNVWTSAGFVERTLNNQDIRASA